MAGLLPELLEERLAEARQTYKLNVGYAGLAQLPPGLVDMIKRYNPHIIELELSSNNLTALPDDLAELKHLRTLRLKYNQLRKLPPVVAQLPALAVLELAGNQITRLDSGVVAALTSLRELDLSGNALSELSSAIARLPRLEALHLENNRLESLPDDLGELPRLVRLNVATNALRSLPASMGRLRKIQRINAANNMLVRIPPSMGHLKTIKELNLRYNNLDDRYKNKIEEGLSRLLAFLREEAERERLEEIERLKPIGTAVGPYTEYRCKAEVGQLVRLEFGDFTVDNRCWIRTGHTMTQVNQRIFIFGGVLVKDGTCSNELFWMTTERMEWHSQPTRGDKPCPRHGHVAVYDPEHHQLVVFGGRTAEKKRLDDVYLLDLDTWAWRKAGCEGQGPSPREGAAADYYAGHMVLFGGHAARARTNDLFLLELTRMAWSQPTTSGPAPSPRSGAAACVGAGRYFFVSGGKNNFVLEDLAVLDLMSKSWLEVALGGSAPPPRHCHLIGVHDQTLHLFGGLDDLGAPSLRLFRLPVPRAALAAAADAAAAANISGAAAAAAAAAAGDGGGAGKGGGNAAAGAGAAAVASVGGAGVFRAEWEELDSELSYNRSRSVALLNIYQLGSSTLGKPPDDDAEKGFAFWDVFKTSKLEDLRPRAPSLEEAAAAAAATTAAAAAGPGGGRLGGGAPVGKAARVQHSTHSASKMPAGFMSLTDKETRMLAYLKDYAHIFHELYPHRRPLYLTPPNECDIPKFVCTTLRPSLVPYPDLYTLDGACRFVSEAITYEPLDPTLHPPPHLPSPHSVLTWQSGDSFDCAGLLASLLLGAGFDAFVVVGYAPKAVAAGDLTADDCPQMLTAINAGAAPGQLGGVSAPGAVTGQQQRIAAGGKEGSAAGGAAEGTAVATGGGKQQQGAAVVEPGKRKKYQVRPRPALTSKFLKAKEAEAAAAAAAVRSSDTEVPKDEDARTVGAEGSGTVESAAAAARRSSAARSSVTGSVVDALGTDASQGGGAGGVEEEGQVAALELPGQSRRVHAWVLVLPGRREVMEPLFLEPSSGRRYSPAASPYEGVEFVWNASNFWVCMQMPEPHSDSRAPPAAISWDLGDPTKWEAVLDPSQTRPATVVDAPSAAVLPGGGALLWGTSSSIIDGSGLTGARGGYQLSISAMAAAARPRTPGSFSGAQGGPGATAAAALLASGRALAPAASGVLPEGVRLPPGSGGLAGGTSMLRASSRMPGLVAGQLPGTPGSGEHGAAVVGEGGSVRGGGGPASEHARSEYGAKSTAGGGQGTDAEDTAEPEVLPDLPPSWVPELTVPRDQYDMRCPRGARTVVFRRCQVEVFARFGECSRWDGLVQRVTTYADDARSITSEVHELFERRRDKLRERRTLPLQETIEEHFAPGSLFDVKDVTTTRGRRRVINFYHRARLDGLLRRDERIGVKLSETFAGRDDRLVYRSAHFGAMGAAWGSTAAAANGGASSAAVAVAPTSSGPLSAAAVSAAGAAAVDAAGGGGGGASGGSAERPATIVRLAERFGRNPARPADEDVEKRIFRVAAGRVEVRYHLGEGRVPAGRVVLSDGGPAEVVQIDPLAPKPRAPDLLQLQRNLQAAARDVVQAVRDSEWESREIARVRAAQEQSIALEVAYYDVARGKAEASDDEPPEEPSGADYLTPFLPPGIGAGGLTREQCLAVREACLRALKDRLVARAAIIQGRLDEEAGGLARRRAALARDRGVLAAADEEAAERAAEEAAFRVAILQRRLQQHEEAALSRYYELDRRLRNDPRLALLLVPA